VAIKGKGEETPFKTWRRLKTTNLRFRSIIRKESLREKRKKSFAPPNKKLVKKGQYTTERRGLLKQRDQHQALKGSNSRAKERVKEKRGSRCQEHHQGLGKRMTREIVRERHS